MKELEIKKMLEIFRFDKSIIEKLSNYNLDSILDVAFKEKMYDIILELFKPIEINGKVKIYFDIFTYISEPKNSKSFFRRFAAFAEKEKIEEEIYKIDIDKIKRIRIGDTLPRAISGWGHSINNEKDIIYYSEPAFLEAMLDLFKKNIMTISNDTDCCINGANIGMSNIMIDYDSLSSENKELVSELIAEGIAEIDSANDREIPSKINRRVTIYFPTKNADTVEELSNRIMDVIGKFKKQVFLYGRYTVNDMKQYIIENIEKDFTSPLTGFSYVDYIYYLVKQGKISEFENGGITKDKLMELVDIIYQSEEWRDNILALGIYFDEDNDCFWKSKESYDKYIATKQELENEMRI